LLPVFNRFIGKNRVCAKKGNTICIANAFPYKTHISFGGHKGNTVQLGRSDLHSADIRFKGQGNTLIIGDDCYLNGLKTYSKGDRFGNSFSAESFDDGYNDADLMEDDDEI
jgi:hypothetical protein